MAAQLFSHPERQAGLLQVYLQAAEMDLLRDEASIHGDLLREEYHIRTRLDFLPMLTHVC